MSRRDDTKVVRTREEFENLLQEKKQSFEVPIDFREFTFQFGDFKNLDLSNCNFDQSRFTECVDFSQSELTDSSFAGLNFDGGILLDLAEMSTEEESAAKSLLAQDNYITPVFYLYDSTDPESPRCEINCKKLIAAYEKISGEVLSRDESDTFNAIKILNDVPSTTDAKNALLCVAAEQELATFEGKRLTADEFKKFLDARVTDFNIPGLVIEGDIDFSRWELNGFNFAGVTFEGRVNFTGANCSGANFDQATFKKGIIVGRNSDERAKTHFDGSSFHDAQCASVQLFRGANSDGKALEQPIFSSDELIRGLSQENTRSAAFKKLLDAPTTSQFKIFTVLRYLQSVKDEQAEKTWNTAVARQLVKQHKEKKIPFLPYEIETFVSRFGVNDFRGCVVEGYLIPTVSSRTEVSVSPRQRDVGSSKSVECVMDLTSVIFDATTIFTDQTTFEKCKLSREQVKLLLSMGRGDLFQGTDLSGLDLSDLDFNKKFDIKRAILKGTTLNRALVLFLLENNPKLLEGTNLSNCDLSGFDLTGLDFSKCNIDGVILKDSTLDRLQVRYLLAKKLGSLLKGANLSRGDMSYLNLSETVLVDSNLEGSNWTACTIDLDSTVVKKSDPTDIIWDENIESTFIVNGISLTIKPKEFLDECLPLYQQLRHEKPNTPNNDWVKDKLKGKTFAEQLFLLIQHRQEKPGSRIAEAVSRSFYRSYKKELQKKPNGLTLADIETCEKLTAALNLPRDVSLVLAKAKLQTDAVVAQQPTVHATHSSLVSEKIQTINTAISEAAATSTLDFFTRDASTNSHNFVAINASGKKINFQEYLCSLSQEDFLTVFDLQGKTFPAVLPLSNLQNWATLEKPKKAELVQLFLRANGEGVKSVIDFLKSAWGADDAGVKTQLDVCVNRAGEQWLQKGCGLDQTTTVAEDLRGAYRQAHVQNNLFLLGKFSQQFHSYLTLGLLSAGFKLNAENHTVTFEKTTAGEFVRVSASFALEGLLPPQHNIELGPVEYIYKLVDKKYQLVDIQCDNSPLLKQLVSGTFVPTAEESPSVVYQLARHAIARSYKNSDERKLEVYQKKLVTNQEKFDFLKNLATKLKVPLDLSGCDLSGVKFFHANISGITIDNLANLADAHSQIVTFDPKTPFTYRMKNKAGTLIAELKITPDEFLKECKKIGGEKATDTKGVVDGTNYLLALMIAFSKDSQSEKGKIFAQAYYNLYKAQVEKSLQFIPVNDKRALANSLLELAKTLNVKADLSKMNWSGTDFEGLNACGVNFQGSNFDKTKVDKIIVDDKTNLQRITGKYEIGTNKSVYRFTSKDRTYYVDATDKPAVMLNRVQFSTTHNEFQLLVSQLKANPAVTLDDINLLLETAQRHKISQKEVNAGFSHLAKKANFTWQHTTTSSNSHVTIEGNITFQDFCRNYDVIAGISRDYNFNRTALFDTDFLKDIEKLNISDPEKLMLVYAHLAKTPDGKAKQALDKTYLENKNAEVTIKINDTVVLKTTLHAVKIKLEEMTGKKLNTLTTKDAVQLIEASQKKPNGNEAKIWKKTQYALFEDFVLQSSVEPAVSTNKLLRFAADLGVKSDVTLTAAQCKQIMTSAMELTTPVATVTPVPAIPATPEAVLKSIFDRFMQSPTTEFDKHVLCFSLLEFSMLLQQQVVSQPSTKPRTTAISADDVTPLLTQAMHAALPKDNAQLKKMTHAFEEIMQDIQKERDAMILLEAFPTHETAYRLAHGFSMISDAINHIAHPPKTPEENQTQGYTIAWDQNKTNAVAQTVALLSALRPMLNAKIDSPVAQWQYENARRILIEGFDGQPNSYRSMETRVAEFHAFNKYCDEHKDELKQFVDALSRCDDTGKEALADAKLSVICATINKNNCDKNDAPKLLQVELIELKHRLLYEQLLRGIQLTAHVTADDPTKDRHSTRASYGASESRFSLEQSHDGVSLLSRGSLREEATNLDPTAETDIAKREAAAQANEPVTYDVLNAKLKLVVAMISALNDPSKELPELPNAVKTDATIVALRDRLQLVAPRSVIAAVPSTSSLSGSATPPTEVASQPTTSREEPTPLTVVSKTPADTLQVATPPERLSPPEAGQLPSAGSSDGAPETAVAPYTPRGQYSSGLFRTPGTERIKNAQTGPTVVDVTDESSNDKTAGVLPVGEELPLASQVVVGKK